MKSTKVLVVAGLGDSVESWESVLGDLPAEWCTHVVTLGQLSSLDNFNVQEAVANLGNYIDGEVTDTHLVGLSAGAMIALSYAGTQEVASVFASAPQLNPSRVAVSVQNFIFRLLPARVFASAGLTKKQMMSVARELATLDLTDEVRHIAAPTMVACGSRDVMNIRAARQTSELVPDAALVIIAGAGHEWHRTKPAEFAQQLQAHIERAKS